MSANKIYTIERDLSNSIPEIEVVDANVSQNAFKKLFDKLKSFLINYFSISTIGGLYYLTVHGMFHRIIWFSVIVASLYVYFFVTVGLLKSPEILTTHEMYMRSISEIPFPAVTVCSTVKVDHRRYNHRQAGQEFMIYQNITPTK